MGVALSDHSAIMLLSKRRHRARHGTPSPQFPQSHTCDDLNRSHSVLLGLVRQHGPMHDIADGIDAWHAGAEVVVDGHPPTGIDLDAHVLQAEALEVGAAA